MSETYRIDIPIDVQDRSGPPFQAAQQRVSGFERSVLRTTKALDRMSGGRWSATVSATDRASAVVSKVLAAGSSLAGKTWSVTVRAVDLVTAPLRAIGRLVTSVGGLLVGGAAAYGGVLAPLQMADDLTRANTGFKTFLGSAEKAKTFLADIQKFGADTPFESDWLTQQATTLLPALDKDPRMVMRTLKAFGDAGALTGAATTDIELALMGFRQIGSVGTLSMEELRQVTENLRVPLSLITDELGVAQSEVKDLGRKGIPAAKAWDAILRALERPADKGGFLGGMASQMETLSGQASMLQDNIKLNLVQRWGKGLESGAIPLLKEFNGMFASGAAAVKGWGDVLEHTGRSVSGWLTDKVREGSRAIEGMTNSLAWQGADTTWDKMKVGWRQLIEQPFEEWWARRGAGWVTEKAAAMGQGFGSALGGFLSSALGVASGSQNNNPFVEAGTTAGKAFLDAFLVSFDAKQIAGQLTHEMGKVAPGGESPTGATWLGWLGAVKAGGGVLATIGPLIQLFKWLRSTRGGVAGPVGPGGPLPPVATIPTAAAPVQQAAKTILDQFGRPLLTVGEQAAGPTVTAAGAAGAGAGAAGVSTAAVIGAGAGGAVLGGVLAYAISTAFSNFLESRDARDRAALDKDLASRNATPEQMRALANTPATIGAAKPELSFWEDLFLSPWAKAQREEKWQREQEASRQAAMANWKPPAAATMTDQEEQDSLRRVYRAIRTANAETAPAPASPPPAPKTDIHVDYRPQISITTTADPEDVLRILKANHSSVVDDIAGQLANMYTTVRANMPRVRQPIAE